VIFFKTEIQDVPRIVEKQEKPVENPLKVYEIYMYVLYIQSK